jgi:hypothetical protein
MNTIFRSFLVAVSQLIIIAGIQAQDVHSKLNQIELMKQFIGTWKCELGRDTFLITETKPFGTGMISKSQILTKDNVLDSIIQVFGFDKKADKFIMAELIKSSQAIEICSTWFTSDKAGEILIINPDNAPLKFKFEFKSPTKLVQTATYGDQIVKVVTGVKLR